MMKGKSEREGQSQTFQDANKATLVSEGSYYERDANEHRVKVYDVLTRHKVL